MSPLLVLAALGGRADARAWQASDAPSPVSIQGPRTTWQALTLTCATAIETDELLHPAGESPFLDFRMTVRFHHPASGTDYVVPGFYAADGEAADSSASGGHRWRAMFTPDRPGWWAWTVEFRRGPEIALAREMRGASADPLVDGAFGGFRVAPADPSAPGFLAKGMLRHVDEPFFRFAGTLEPYLKSGAGGPENFLAYFEFDGTLGNPNSTCLPAPQRLHRYDTHAADFTGDAVDLRHTWGAEPKGANILGAINYLASQGVNSLYFVTDGHHGDGNDVWPWVTATDKLHYDVSKLAQWERVFAHMSARGIQLQVVLEESENDQLSLSSGGLGYGLTRERRLYYREIIARFAHHPAVIWVVGDESNYFDEPETMESLATELRTLDPYRHPITFHGKHPCSGSGCAMTYPSVYAQYSTYFSFPHFEASAFQTVPGAYNNSTVQLRAGQESSRKWAHYGDEQSLNAIPPNLDENRRKALWGNLMGGGAGVAWYPGNNVRSQYPMGYDACDYYDVSLEDLRLFEGYFAQTRHALEIFRQELPFTEMVAENALATRVGPQDYVLFRPEDALRETRAVYAVYRGTGSETELVIGAGLHCVDWFDPRTGAGPLAAPSIEGPGAVLLPPAPVAGLDWLAIVRQR